MLYYYDLLKTLSVFIVGIQLVFGVFRWIYENVIGPNLLEPKNLRQYGHWALVTGATDGIGKQYAKSLAKRGLNIILVSRTLTKLQDVAKEISETFNVETQVITVDFTSGSDIYDQIRQQIIGKEIGILVNNVGMTHATPECFLNIPNREKLIQDIIKCNITSVPMMCSLILPQMVERKRGLIINVSSLSSILPFPTMAIYSASKAFITKFSTDLASEYECQGINVQVLLTGVVRTNMSKVKESTFTIPTATASEYVESALRYVGYARVTNGYLPHSFMQFMMQSLFFIAPSFVEGMVKKEMDAHRDKVLKEGSSTPTK